MLPCPTKTLTGYDCPGCGMQRSLAHLLQGEFSEAFWVYPAIYPILILGVAILLARYYPIPRIEGAIRWSATAAVTLVLLNFLIKLFK